jgi:hypothetical protein
MKLLVISATAMALAAPALAQQPPTYPAAVDFTKVDADKNGALSISEVKVVDATVTQAIFDKADTDKSKSLSKVEFETYWASMKKDDHRTPG